MLMITILTDPSELALGVRRRKLFKKKRFQERWALESGFSLHQKRMRQASAAGVRFSSKFERNRKDKRATIKASSVFGESSSSASGNRLLELDSKRRKIRAGAVSALLAGRVKPSSSLQTRNGPSGQNGRSVVMARS